MSDTSPDRSGGNGQEEPGSAQNTEYRTKRCPRLDIWCKGEACALWEELFQVINGVRVKRGMCSDLARNAILSGISQQIAQAVQGQKEQQIQQVKQVMAKFQRPYG